MMRDFLTQSSRRRHRGLEGIYNLDIRPKDRRHQTLEVYASSTSVYKVYASSTSAYKGDVSSASAYKGVGEFWVIFPPKVV